MPLPLRVKAFPNAQLRMSEPDYHLYYAAFVEEYARRFGTLLDGWWFDGGCADPRYRQAMVTVRDAARAGNPGAIVTFNNGSICLGFSRPLIPGQDYLSGESEFLLKGKIRYGRGTDVLTPMPKGPSSKGLIMGRGVTDCIGYVSTLPLPQPPPTCLWHALLPIDCMWQTGIPFNPDWQNPAFPWVAPKPHQMEKPLYTLDDLETVVRDFKSVGGGVTFNVGIFQEGVVGPRTIAQLAELSKRIPA